MYIIYRETPTIDNSTCISTAEIDAIKNNNVFK